MGVKTNIGWCDHTFNCWWGCTKVGGSPACENCYAETWAKRTGFNIWGDDQPRRYFGDKHWNEPIAWNRAAEKAEERRRVFCMSMGDWAEGRPEQKPHLDRWWNLCLDTPWLDKLMLTKRPQLINKLCPLRSQTIWHGVTAETQKWTDIRWSHLRDVDCEIKWFSVEPLFERILLPDDFLSMGRRGWVIVGGESGPRARPMESGWAEYLRDQCVEAGVPFFFKQWGNWIPDGDTMVHVSDKKVAGDILAGDLWKQFPRPGIS